VSFYDVYDLKVPHACRLLAHRAHQRLRNVNALYNVQIHVYLLSYLLNFHAFFAAGRCRPPPLVNNAVARLNQTDRSVNITCLPVYHLSTWISTSWWKQKRRVPLWWRRPLATHSTVWRLVRSSTV